MLFCRKFSYMRSRMGTFLRQEQKRLRDLALQWTLWTSGLDCRGWHVGRLKLDRVYESNDRKSLNFPCQLLLPFVSQLLLPPKRNIVVEALVVITEKTYISSNFIIVALEVHDYEYQLQSLASPKHIQESFKVPMMYVHRYSVDFVESFCEKKLPCVQVLIEPGPVEWEDFLKYKICSVGRKLKLCFSEDLIFTYSYPIFSRIFAYSSDGYPCRWTLRHFEFFLCQVNLPFQLRSIMLNSLLEFLAIKSADKAVIESGHDFNERPTHESSVSPNRNFVSLWQSWQ